MSSTVGTGASPRLLSKSKRDEQKFYAVQVGRKPGIYYDWPECQKQITSFPQAKFKSFPSIEEAENFVKNGLSSRSTNAAQKFYAVKVGHNPGIYLDWNSASAQIKGCTKPKYKSFLTRAEAESFMNGDSTLSKPQSKTKRRKVSNGDDSIEHADDEVQMIFEPGTAPMRTDAEDGFDHRLILKADTGEIVYKTKQQRNDSKMQAIGPSQGGVLQIWTDGSSTANGTSNASAGIGIYFGPQDPRSADESQSEGRPLMQQVRNLGEMLAGPRQTNQRAELTAISRALDIAPRDRAVLLVTDSMYAINCCTKWFAKWRNNNWQNSVGKPVENRDLVESVLDKIAERTSVGSDTTFKWVKGHSNDEGNTAADSLALGAAEERRRTLLSIAPADSNLKP